MMCHHKPKSIVGIISMILLGVLTAAVVGLLLGFVVMWLWNWLMPTIFGLTSINFWQAWGLVLLSHILFKSFPHHKHSHDDEHHKKWREHFKNKFSQNQPELHEQES